MQWLDLMLLAALNGALVLAMAEIELLGFCNECLLRLLTNIFSFTKKDALNLYLISQARSPLSPITLHQSRMTSI